MLNTKSITIDKHFARLCPPMSSPEFDGLRESIREHGCRDALVVWKGRDILLDGHNRHRICTELDVPFSVVEYEFATREDAHNWAIDNQLGRRNLSAGNRKYLLGKRYMGEKLAQGARTDLTSGHDDPKSDRTSEKIAAQHDVSEKTVRRAATFATAVDEITEAAGPEAKGVILDGTVTLSDADVQELAASAPKSVDDVRAFADQRQQQRADLRKQREPNPDGAWGQKAVIEQIPGTDEQGQYVAARKLSCGHVVQASRRVEFPSKSKSAPCPECNPGTRKPHEERKRLRAVENAIRGALEDDEQRSALVQLVSRAWALTAFRHSDQRVRRLVDEIGRLGVAVGFGESDVR